MTRRTDLGGKFLKMADVFSKGHGFTNFSHLKNTKNTTFLLIAEHGFTVMSKYQRQGNGTLQREHAVYGWIKTINLIEKYEQLIALNMFNV